MRFKIKSQHWSEERTVEADIVPWQYFTVGKVKILKQK